ncbi:sulfate adenylyltransferase [Oceanobacillus caeni]|uniref:Sulfate adenylyltransferase n=1 Tax=Oceanobacillus caeni TaxID=405946 RepID=A0ABR5MM11_9BACI|nr:MULTISPECIES: sulfate adenylyltransferase [Bacillaceae]KKE80470.1 sulfate adenylyltransferase [Bacilli bacterium VT-13-104]PZD83191.1 sulfate adenylyltransferase [Bacilli bacterium]KPH77446.1 sulfate adenylyltransferase [Oceanobacillus caeni]MBU8790718.1 sulfate adenylyltransferase [Oceanobacillus caeni]MCR1835134.1 sulfate adenylyltransferase [Oceanobacillus caeni]
MSEINFASFPQKPHGGKLVNGVLTGIELEKAMEKAKELPMIMVDLEAVITLEMIATGVLSPNEGFMVEEDYISVLTEGRLKNGVVWPVPLSFAPIGDRNKEVIKTLSVGDEVVLADETKEPVAILKLDDIFHYERDFRATHLFGTKDRNHPGVDSIYRRMGDTALGGPIQLLRRVHWGPFENLRMEPKDTWKLFYEQKKFHSVGGFITGANPLHRGHEYIHRNALEELDGLFVQPLVEMAKREYTRHEFRMLSYRSVLDTYYPKDRTVLAPLRVTYIFAGPREAVLHALIMKNYGCTHALIGRDHAGIGDYYDKYASHSIFDEFTADELGIDIRLFHEVFYCTRCDNPATEQTCPHGKQYRINISGTGIRELLRYGVLPPKEIVRPESARIAMQGVQPKGVDENNQAINPVGKTIKSIFPYYLESSRIGGPKRKSPLKVEELTIEDLENVIRDVRTNADRVYKGIFDEFSYVTDTLRSTQDDWVSEARESIYKQQEMVVEYLEEKVNKAPEKASDEFMYQDRGEAQHELEVARKIFDDIPAALREKDLEYRIWNPLPYKRYRGSDEE